MLGAVALFVVAAGALLDAALLIAFGDDSVGLSVVLFVDPFGFDDSDPQPTNVPATNNAAAIKQTKRVDMIKNLFVLRTAECHGDLVLIL